MWVRAPTFATLVLTILEQQVSLASAYAAFQKLKEKIGLVTPSKLVKLTDEDMRNCYFTRQKMKYARELAESIQQKKLVLKNLTALPDDEVRKILKQHKGIGDWTADVYLIHALNRVDIFPIGDLALVKSMKEVRGMDMQTATSELLEIAEAWKPYRTIATMLLWHAYIQKRKMKINF